MSLLSQKMPCSFKFSQLNSYQIIYFVITAIKRKKNILLKVTHAIKRKTLSSAANRNDDMSARRVVSQRLSPHLSQVVHQVGAYPDFLSMKWLGVFLLLPGWDASPLQRYPSIKFVGTHLYTWVERGTVRVKCLAQEHNTMTLARVQT